MGLLFSAVEKIDLLKLKELISSGEDLNQLDSYGYSALHVASANEQIDIAILLIESGIDVNIQDKKGQTILHYVALRNQLQLTKVLFDRGADLSISDIYGNEPLWTAVFNDKGLSARIEIIKLFLKHGGNINHVNKAGKSPKDIIVIGGYNNLTSFIK